MTYEEAVAYLLEIPKFAGKAGHDNLRRYLHRLGDPHLAVPTIHIAGTNGKGSVCAFLASILRCAGYRVGMFTSPHLIKINERFRLGDTQISDEEFVSVYRMVQQVVDEEMAGGCEHPNFFEFLFMMAACWYSRESQEGNVDYVIYETGLGGRLDATNVLCPCVTVITSIGLDHMQYLGDTITQIASEKAGIIKPGVPCVYLAEPAEAGNVIKKRAEELMVHAVPVEPSQIIIEKYDKDWIDFMYQSMYDSTCSFRIRSTALYQTENAMLAVKAAELLLSRNGGLDVDQYRSSVGEQRSSRSIIVQGLKDMYWSGRMEEIAPEFYVDGAHNEPAIIAFCDTITRMYQDRFVILLFAVSSDKSYNKMIQILCERLHLKEVIVTAIYGARTTPVSDVAELFRTYWFQGGQAAVDQGWDDPRNTEHRITEIEDLRQAYDYAATLLEQTENCRIFAVGSLYLVGSLLEFMNDQ